MPSTSDINHICILAGISRLCFLFLSAVSNYIISDHSPNSFSAPAAQLDQYGIFDRIIWILFGGLLRWDAQHFFHIASSGYTYENNVAFFPMFPLVTKGVAYLIKLMFGLNGTTSWLLTAFVLNSIFFIKASITLYTLTLSVFKNQVFAYYSVLFFFISPATVFFLAPYTESLFCFCVFNGMLNYSQQKYWKSQLWFSASVLVRSNGIVNVGFILHLFFYYILRAKFRDYKVVLMYILFGLVSVCCTILPFVAYQLYIYLIFCKSQPSHPPVIYNFARKNNLILSGTGSVWCNISIPFSYSYVQYNHWDVGFLRYYQWKQIPNFCLAGPVVFLIFNYCGVYLYYNWRLLFTVDKIYNIVKGPLNKLSPSAFVYVVHVTYLTIFAVTNINVQVTTRLIASSSPLIYWIAAHEFIGDKSCNCIADVEQFSFFKWFFHFHNTKSGFLIKLYFIVYAVLGTVIFSNDYPWT